jgi:predicted naringenin-chalcone synthase/NAD(P)-dependent dehydrogenase (short-subunit alcohol dehydrogenase family)
MLAVNRERIFPHCREETAQLYEKLLGKDPSRTRKFAVVPYERVFDLDIHAKFELFQRSSLALMRDVGQGLLRQTSLDAQEIDFLVVCYMAGKSLPSLNALAANELGLRPDVISVTLGDMGCSAAVAAIDLASRMLRAERVAKRALVMALEPVTSLFQNDEEPGSVVGNTLFGEGCAGVIVSSYAERPLYRIGPSQRILSADDQALGSITLASRETGPMICLSREIPEVAGKAVEMNLRRLVPRILPLRDKVRFLLTRRTPRWQKRIDRWAIHPGGRAVLKGMQANLRLSEADLGPSYKVFQERSNTSSPSVLYALENVERTQPRRGEKVMLMSFGSGFKVNAMVLERGSRVLEQTREKSAVVVGGTSGIGLEVAKVLAGRGYRLFIGSRRVGNGKGYEALEGAEYLNLDVTDSDSVRAFSDAIWQKTYGVDLLVISSGVAQAAKAVGRQDDRDIAQMVDTNLTGAMRLTNALLPRMRQGSHVIYLNSILGRIPLMGSATYCATKAGLSHFCAAVELELRRAGRKVQLHNLFPAYVETPLLDQIRGSNKTFLKPIEAAKVAAAVGRIIDGRASSGGFMLARDRAIATFYKYMPRAFQRIVAQI